MNNEEVTIRVTEENYARKYLQLRTYNLLSKTQYDVVAEIAKKGLVGTEERKEIREKLKMSVNSFNNVLHAMKTKGLLVHDEANQMYRVKVLIPPTPGSITFNFEKQ